LNRLEELSPMGTPAVLNLQTEEQKVRTPGEKSELSRKVLSRKIKCFKVIKTF